VHKGRRNVELTRGSLEEQAEVDTPHLIVSSRRLPAPPLWRGMGRLAHAPAGVSIGREIMSWLGRALGEHEADGSGWPSRWPR
jgi:hypothetical protein